MQLMDLKLERETIVFVSVQNECRISLKKKFLEWCVTNLMKKSKRIFAISF